MYGFLLSPTENKGMTALLVQVLQLRRTAEVPVRRINHRELRNNSAEVLRAVAAGETIEVTNHGEVAAVLVPPVLTPYERLAAAGKIREPRKDRPVDLRNIRRVRPPLSSAEIIADLRGDR